MTLAKTCSIDEEIITYGEFMKLQTLTLIQNWENENSGIVTLRRSRTPTSARAAPYVPSGARLTQAATSRPGEEKFSMHAG